MRSDEEISAKLNTLDHSIPGSWDQEHSAKKCAEDCAYDYAEQGRQVRFGQEVAYFVGAVEILATQIGDTTAITATDRAVQFHTGRSTKEFARECVNDFRRGQNDATLWLKGSDAVVWGRRHGSDSRILFSATEKCTTCGGAGRVTDRQRPTGWKWCNDCARTGWQQKDIPAPRMTTPTISPAGESDDGWLLFEVDGVRFKPTGRKGYVAAKPSEKVYEFQSMDGRHALIWMPQNPCYVVDLKSIVAYD